MIGAGVRFFRRKGLLRDRRNESGDGTKNRGSSGVDSVLAAIGISVMEAGESGSLEKQSAGGEICFSLCESGAGAGIEFETTGVGGSSTGVCEPALG